MFVNCKFLIGRNFFFKNTPVHLLYITFTGVWLDFELSGVKIESNSQLVTTAPDDVGIMRHNCSHVARTLDGLGFEMELAGDILDRSRRAGGSPFHFLEPIHKKATLANR